MASELLIILALVLANGVFAGAEIAILSLRKTRVDQLASEGSRRAIAVRTLRDRPERFLATVQVGITVIGATAAAFGGASIVERLAPMLRTVEAIADSADEIAVGVVVVLVSFLTLVIGELVPKSLALKFGERYALLVGRPLLFLSSIARPIVWLLTVVSNVLLRPFGDRTTFIEARLSADELRQLVIEATQSGALGKQIGEIASRAIDFERLTVADVMVPRDRIAAIRRDAPVSELMQMFGQGGHSRLPVYEKDLDHIVGYVTAREILTDALAGSASIEKRLRPILFVPEGKSTTSVLQRMQRERSNIVMVVDEFGGIAGLVTIADLVEEVVGEMFTEHAPAEELFVDEGGGAFLVKGYTPLHQVGRALDVDFPEGDYSTIAGFTIHLAGKIPAPKEIFSLPDGSTIEIVDATPRVVRSLRIRPKR